MRKNRNIGSEKDKSKKASIQKIMISFLFDFKNPFQFIILLNKTSLNRFLRCFKSLYIEIKYN